MDYETWRLFLEEFAWRKRIHHDFMLDKLAQAGKPSQYQVQNVSLPRVQAKWVDLRKNDTDLKLDQSFGKRVL